MADYQVHQVPSMDDEIGETWSRDITDRTERDIHGVHAAKMRDVVKWQWQVNVWAMGFVRDVPLEAELRRRIAQALGSVPGVVEAREGDREFWIVRGDPDGKTLVAVVAGIVDDLAGDIRAYRTGRRTKRTDA